MIPFARMEFASSCIRSGSKTRRGWTGLGSISSMRTLVGVCGVGNDCVWLSATTSGLGGNRAVNPLPKALRGASCGLFIGEHLLGQLDITFGSLGAKIIAQDGFAIAGSFGEANIPRDYGSKNLTLEEIPQILSHLPGEGGSIVEHGEQDALDLQVVVEGIAYPVDSVEKFRNAFQGEEFALDGYEHGICGQ